MTYSAKQIETEAAYVVADIQRDPAIVLDYVDGYETALRNLFKLCADDHKDAAEVGRRVLEQLFLPTVRRMAIDRIDEAPSPFETQADEDKFFDNLERARDWRRSA